MTQGKEGRKDVYGAGGSMEKACKEKKKVAFPRPERERGPKSMKRRTTRENR